VLSAGLGCAQQDVLSAGLGCAQQDGSVKETETDLGQQAAFSGAGQQVSVLASLLLTTFAAIIVPADRMMMQKINIFQSRPLLFGMQQPSLQSQC